MLGAHKAYITKNKEIFFPLNMLSFKSPDEDLILAC
jgi:hypothetical protein